jgi:hypothetical protein
MTEEADKFTSLVLEKKSYQKANWGRYWCGSVFATKEQTSKLTLA